jgi:penicillin-binding protein 2
MRRPEAENRESRRRITRRALVMGGAMAAVTGVLTLRMHRLQVREAERYLLLAEENRINIRLIPPARGLIFDRAGVVLADNRRNHRVVMVREDAGDPEAVLGRLARIIPIAAEDQSRLLREMYRRSAFVPVTVAERLSWEEMAAIAVNAPALPGVTPEIGLTRAYPLEADFAHVVGYVGPVSDYDLQRLDDPDPLLQIPDFQIGKYAAEAKMEAPLRGRAGARRVEVNAAGRVIRELDRQEGEAGADIQLTVDHQLQNFVQARLAGESAAAVVMEIATGDIRALGSAPGFDPNAFVSGISVSDYDALLNNERRPLVCKSAHGAYPPGSTFKMVVALAALEAGAVRPDETVFCPGHYELGDRRFHCWRRGGHGQMDLHNSLKQSCDVYYYDVAQRVGIDAIAAMARKLGLGERYDLPVPITGGLVPDRAWKRRVRDAAWRIGDTLNAGIGQGDVLTSPLQLAVMTARIASGRAVAPRLVHAVGGVRTPVSAPPMDIAEDALRQIRRGMFAVSNDRRGTAWRTRIGADALRMAGKTGTSQVRNITVEERARGVTRNEDLPWNRRDHALFVAFAPYAAPRYAVSVVVEHGGGGSVAAAPIARDIMLAALGDGRPDIAAYPAGQREAARARIDALDLRPPLRPGGAATRA